MIDPRIVSRRFIYTHIYMHIHIHTYTSLRSSIFLSPLLFRIYSEGDRIEREDRSRLRDTSIHDKKDSCLLLLRSITYITLFSLYHIVEIVSLYV